MKYIQKVEPTFFEEDVNKLRDELKQSNAANKKDYWGKYKQKRKLKGYMLANEQYHLCGYCECRVDLDNSHIEHIEPKSYNYDLLTFNYRNLIVSCNGDCSSERPPGETCGHKKNANFNKLLFLNPTIETNISDHFKYTKDGDIIPNHKKNKHAKYTLKLLNLAANDTLKRQRLIAQQAFRDSVRKKCNSTGETIKEVAKKLLENNNTPFISFLKYQYKIAI